MRWEGIPRNHLPERPRLNTPSKPSLLTRLLYHHASSLLHQAVRIAFTRGVGPLTELNGSPVQEGPE